MWCNKCITKFVESALLSLLADTNEIRNPEYATTQGQRSAEGVMESVYAEIHGEAEGERSKEPVYEDIKCMQSK